MTDRKGFSAIEFAIVIALIAIFVGVIYLRYETYKNEVYKKLVDMDLRNLHLIITLYKVKNGRNPVDLLELNKKGYLLSNDGNSVLTVFKFKDGRLISERGKIVYNRSNGEIRYVE